MPKSKKTQKPQSPITVLVRVSVHQPGGAHLKTAARVSLRPRTAKPSKTRKRGPRGRRRVVTLRRAKGALLYEAQVAPGRYTLTVATRNKGSAPPCHVEVGQQDCTFNAYLGQRDWPVYRYGKNMVPFEPRDDLLAVTFPTRPPGPTKAAAEVKKLTRQLPLTPYEHSDDEKLAFRTAEGGIWLFTLDEPKARPKMPEQIRKILRRPDCRVGVPIDLIPGQVKVMDNRFVIRFRAHLKPEEIRALVRKADGLILRSFIQAENARYVEFQSGEFRDHLATVEGWVNDDLLIYGEPDVMAELTDDVFPADPPDDPTYAIQNNLTLQGVDLAWQFLNGVDPNLTLGSPNTYVATCDRGVQLAHTDIGGNLTDGQPQLAQCYDISNLQACTAVGYAPETDHGMGVYGIIGALTNNTTMMSGIAPNTHQIGILRASYWDAVNYPDMLLWAGGFVSGNASVGWPAEPIGNPADIISCSHGANGLALSGIMDDTLTYLSVYGRGGRGTLTVYSAGNSAALITGFRVWAAHPRTMAISNSQVTDVLDGSSNYGPEIDICAQGTNAPSLNDTGGEQTFGGTSAAAPTVAAAAALMLSVEPTLTWIDLRDILRGTSVVIDAANVDPIGQWIAGFSQWYGFGRLNVNLAVQEADALDTSAVNLLVRENLDDDGSIVPSTGNWWRSPDIWVRNVDPAVEAIGDPAYDADPPHQSAVGGADNWVRVRLKNVGTDGSANVYVRLYLTHFAGSEFQYPTDYIPSINSGDPIPSPLVQGTYLLGEQLLNFVAAGDVQILDFLWDSALVPPEEVLGANWHPCLLAELSPHTGPDPSGIYVWDNTNLAQRNITIDYDDFSSSADPSDDGPDVEMTGVIGHQDNPEPIKRIVVHRGRAPKKAKIWLRFLDPRVERSVRQHLKDPDPAGSRCACCCGKTCCCNQARSKGRNDSLVVEQRGEHRIFRLKRGSRLELDVPMVAGRLTPVVVGVSMPGGTAKGIYPIVVIEQDQMARRLGAFEMDVVVR